MAGSLPTLFFKFSSNPSHAVILLILCSHKMRCRRYGVLKGKGCIPGTPHPTGMWEDGAMPRGLVSRISPQQHKH